MHSIKTHKQKDVHVGICALQQKEIWDYFRIAWKASLQITSVAEGWSSGNELTEQNEMS